MSQISKTLEKYNGYKFVSADILDNGYIRIVLSNNKGRPGKSLLLKTTHITFIPRISLDSQGCLKMGYHTKIEEFDE